KKHHVKREDVEITGLVDEEECAHNGARRVEDQRGKIDVLEIERVVKEPCGECEPGHTDAQYQHVGEVKIANATADLDEASAPVVLLEWLRICAEAGVARKHHEYLGSVGKAEVGQG